MIHIQRHSSPLTGGESASKRQGKKPVACRRCHAQKVKCSGGQPCAKCRLTGHANECEYITRDRKVRVNESYLERLLSENKHFREELAQSRTALSKENEAGPSQPRDDCNDDDIDSNLQNPLVGGRAWFHDYDPSAPPIYIGEAACTAYATRLRQFLTNDKAATYIPRTQYTKESTLSAMHDVGLQWPNLEQARLLVKIAFNQAGRVYHLALHRSTLEKLDKIYQTSTFDDPVLTCKFFGLFALGNVYSARSDASMDCRVPGTAYYVRAMNLITILPVRPSITHIECLLLLSLFSYFLNRQHSGYLLIGSAMRLGLILGLNNSILEHQCPDPLEREHRVRIWWAIYVFDRMWGSKTGFPMQVLDADINVGLPSDVTMDAPQEQIFDTQYFIASIHLAKIAGQIIEKVYSRKAHKETFLQREQRLLSSLKQWVQDLPKHIRLGSTDTTPKHIVSLHLQFNQCVILATRPALLHALIELRATNGLSEGQESRGNVSQVVVTLAEACVYAARHSHFLITEEWIGGSLPKFGYFYAQYLFSCGLVLAISGLIPIGNPSDLGSVETALEILRSVGDHGNLAASDFHENLVRVKQCLESRLQSDPTDRHGNGDPTPAVSHAVDCPPPSVGDAPSRDIPVVLGNSVMNPSSLDAPVNGGLTTEMAFQRQMMQDFLTLSNTDPDLLNPVQMSTGDAEALYMYPDLSLH